MPDTNPQQTLATNASEFRLKRFEAAWLAWRPAEPAPRWQEHLPADDKPCGLPLLFDLIKMDINYRIRAKLPALLAECYFEHPRLLREDARLGDAQQVELIQWEYLQRLKNGERPRRAEYEAAFPQHREALRDMKLRSRCPQCQKSFVLQETGQALHCPDCGGESSLLAAATTADVDTPSSTPAPPPRFDLRDYELMETLGQGGMGAVYRCRDPGLGRDLAIKVIKADYRGHPLIEGRFLREARITGSLQHPHIVPVHNLGRLADGRLHYTMRLVRGQTFADMLKEEAGKAERLPHLLTIFEKICQAVAYAHSKHVIHRDLKPANVMVGRFGEVQVMDWGLAKVLMPEDGAADSEERMDAAGTRIPTEANSPAELSHMGSVFGTLQYMSSEQARGKWDAVDERADVFALGAILCEILTGQPAYIGSSYNELIDRVERGDVAEALERLQKCGADAELTALCCACLSAEREARPRDAAVVAKRVAEYQAEVQERLRQAELERVAAESRAKAETERAREALARVKAERRARRRMLALAAAVLLLLASGGGGLWWRHFKQEQTDREALAIVERAGEQLEEGWQQQDITRLTEVKAEADRAAGIARSGGASETVGQQVSDFQTKVQEYLARAEKNRDLLNALLDIATPHETKTYQAAGSGQVVMAIAEPSVEEQYAAAFRRRWPDVAVDKQTASEVASRIHEEPEVVLHGVAAGLDGWMMERRQQRAEAQWRRLLALVDRLDPSEPRRQLRTLLIGATPPSAASVAGLLAGRPPWPALWQLARGNDWRRLRQLRSQMNAMAEPVLTVLLLARASSAAGDLAGAEEVLRQALARRPDEVALLDALGKVLEQQKRLTEAIGCYRAARGKHPEWGVALARSLGEAGQGVEAESISRDLIRRQPNNPEMLLSLGNALNNQKRYADAESAYRKAINLKPNYAAVYSNLSVVLERQGKHADAEATCRKAIALKPDFAEAFINLGTSLSSQKKYAEAKAAWREAIDLKPDYALAYRNIGTILYYQMRYADAESACRKAIDLKPDYAEAYLNLGNVLYSQKKYADAEAVCRKAIALKPDYAEGYYNLGIFLIAQEKIVEAELAYGKAIDLKPDFAEAYYNLGNLLYGQQKYEDAEAAFRKTIALKPDLAEPHYNLGTVLRVQGRFTESLAAYRRSHELRSKDSSRRVPSLLMVREAERFVELENQLPAIVTGEASPANTADAIILASMCQQPYQKRYATSARLYADAFTVEPKLAADLNQQHRYNAACAAALAAAGQGEDARLLPDKVTALFRRWAIAWLRDELTAYARLAAQNNPKANQAIQQSLAHWRSDPDLASVRDPSALDRLPDAERAAWQALWRDVDELAKRAAKRDAAKK